MANRAIWRVTNVLLHYQSRFIKFQESDQIKANFHNIAKLPGVLGCIDGTHVQIQQPIKHEHQYVNRNNVVARWPGSTHDSRILRLSNLYQQFENHEFDGLLLGDSGYPCRPWLMNSLPDPESNTENRFNIAQCSLNKHLGIGNDVFILCT
uniref:DDE Tnp4 domain-containing protein n=1 Tax=Romanomermis culicivorax TaxID=13658 RepID=A0A915IH54_ROMCU